MRQELNADLDLDSFEHRALYNAEAGRIEMHLVSRAEQQLRMNGRCLRINEGESLHTENFYKCTPDEFLALAAQSRFRPLRHWVDSDGLFAIYLLAADG